MIITLATNINLDRYNFIIVKFSTGGKGNNMLKSDEVRRTFHRWKGMAKKFFKWLSNWLILKIQCQCLVTKIRLFYSTAFQRWTFSTVSISKGSKMLLIEFFALIIMRFSRASYRFQTFNFKTSKVHIIITIFF